MAPDPPSGGRVKPDLAQLLADWQRKLRLQDWRIAISYVPDLTTRDGRPCFGLCSPFVDGKEARIQIRDPELSKPIPGAVAMPIEETIVHELLHLHLAPLSEQTPAGIAAEEQAVWAITEAMTSTRDAGQRAQMTRALLAVSARFSAARRGRQQGMDPILIAALEAAIASGDMKQIEALVASLKGQSGEAPPGEAPAEQGAPGAPEETPPPPKAAGAAPADPKAQRAAGVRVGALPAPAAPRLTVPSSQLVTRSQLADLDRKIERQGIERVLDKHPAATEAQRAFAIHLGSTELAEGYLKTLGAPAPAATGAAPRERTQLGTVPTSGARAQTLNPVHSDVDRRMGLRTDAPQAISRDPVSGKLTISNIATNAVTRGDGKVGAS
jgi:hypothetical protein